MQKTHAYIRPEHASVPERLRGLPGRFPAEISRQVNVTARRAQSEFIRLVERQMNVRRKSIEAATSLRLSTSRTLEARITIRGRRISLYSFKGPRINKQTISWKIATDGIRKSAATPAFANIVKTGSREEGSQRMQFMRRVRKKANGVFARHPIMILKGPSIPRFYAEYPDLQESLGREVSPALARAIAQGVQTVLVNARNSGAMPAMVDTTGRVREGRNWA